VSLGDIDVEHVEQAMAEADELGRAAFLERYGFGHATTYLVRHRGRFYDPKAVIGAAHGYTEEGEPLTVSGPDSTESLGRLRALGFEIVPFKGLWWVNQGSTYRQERDGGYVWAPKVTKAGHPVAHHVAVSQLREGQQIVHYAGGAIRAVSLVTNAPQNVKKPDELTGDAWDADGYGCRVAYRVLDTPIERNEVPHRSPSVGPFDANGDVKQGYLFKVQDDELFPLLEFLDSKIPDLFVPPEASNADPFSGKVESRTMQSNTVHHLVHAFKNIVLEGVPGTGKSYAIEKLAAEWAGNTGRNLVEFAGKPYAAQVMHPSTSYEDFIEGLRPSVESLVLEPHTLFDQPVVAGGEFVVADGFFLKVCARAAANPSKDVLVLIDELNRCNVSSVLGDLLLTLEASRRATFLGEDPARASASDWEASVPVTLPYSSRVFFVPDNVYVVATTNTTDRSVAPLDAAIRRRFAFFRIEPDTQAAIAHARRVLPSADAETVQASGHLLGRLNDDVLSPCLGPDAMLGPSYLYALASLLESSSSSAHVERIWRYNIIPQLIDVTRSYGAEDLLGAGSRDEWFSQHGSQLLEVVDQAQAALAALDIFLAGLGFRILVDGTGLARGARAVDATTGRVDVSYAPFQLAEESDEILSE
jgi:hypothetical protein